MPAENAKASATILPESRRVLLVDDDRLARVALRAVPAERADVEIAGEAVMPTVSRRARSVRLL